MQQARDCRGRGTGQTVFRPQAVFCYELSVRALSTPELPDIQADTDGWPTSVVPGYVAVPDTTMDILIHTAKNALAITTFVFVMMVWVDYINVLSRGSLSRIIAGGQGRQYVVSSLLGAVPGCLGAFMDVSFYLHGLISFGAIVAGMIATSGDEAFVMIAMFPKQALLLTLVLILVGIVSGWLVDRLGTRIRFLPKARCMIVQLHEQDECRCFSWPQFLSDLRNLSMARFALIILLALALYGFVSGSVGSLTWDWKRVTFTVLTSSVLLIVLTVPEHYLEEHVWNHIVKRHLWRVTIWTFGSLGLVSLGTHYFSVGQFVQAHMVWVFLIACAAGIIPESGPHLIFVVLFAEGMIPFSVLLASSIVQDGHGLLPLLSHSLRDTIAVKLINLFFGVVIGGTLYLIGW